MSIEHELKKEGIEIVDTLSTLEVNSIAKNIASKLVKTFPSFHLNESELFIRLSRLHMYRAKLSKGVSEATYFYKNSSIYFNENIPFKKLENFAIHECIHYLQEVKDKKGVLVKLGLCDFTEFKTYGMGLNEAAVQLMTSKILKTPKEEVKFFNINFVSNSSSCYPLECNLLNQIAYLIGEDILFESTLNSNDNFKKAFINATSEKVFVAIQNAFDTIFYTEENLAKLNQKIQSYDYRNQQVDSLVKKGNELKQEINLTFLRTQNLILSSFFDKAFQSISSLNEIDDYINKLQEYKLLIGTSEGYTFFNNYYVEKIVELEHRYSIIENGNLETSLVPVKKVNKFLAIIRAIKKILFTKNQEEIKRYYD